VEPRGVEADSALIAACEQVMVEGGIGPDAFFFAHRGGRNASGALAEVLAPYQAVVENHPYWADPLAQTLLIDDVEAIWAPIAEHDDWTAFDGAIAAIRRMGQAHGQALPPAGH